MNAEERQQLRRILSTCDEAFLIALANPGLVRRAQKDACQIEVTVEEADDCLVVRGPDWTVWMPAAGPAKARDDTKASGVTRHILMATIYLATHWSDQSSEAAVVPESKQVKKATILPEGEQLCESALQLSVEDVLKWAGKRTFEQSSQNIETTELEVEASVGLTLRLVNHDIEVRLAPTKSQGQKLLDELLSTAPKAMHKHYVVMALMALKCKFGKETALPAADSSTDSQAPLSRQQLFLQTEQLLETCLAVGIAHPSERLVERFCTLSLSAVAANLPRLANLLRALADEEEQLLSRDAGADTKRLLSVLSTTHSLVKALRVSGGRMESELTGIMRSRYDQVGDLSLVGVGCYPWSSASGFEGITTVFWCREKGQFFTWSMSRPANSVVRFDAARAYQHEHAWGGGGSPADLCRSAFVLKAAKCNSFGRLSSSKDCSVQDQVALNAASAIEFGDCLFADWTKLATYAAGQVPLGLKQIDPSRRIIVLEPRSWGNRYFDEIQQTFCWQLRDGNSNSIIIVLPWNSLNEQAITFMEALKADRDKLHRVVARINITGSGFTLEPLSFISRGTEAGAIILNPWFDARLIAPSANPIVAKLRKLFPDQPINTAFDLESELDQITHGLQTVQSFPPSLRSLVVEIEDILLRISESGTQRLHRKYEPQLEQISATANRFGLVELATCISRMSVGTDVSAAVLDADYLCRLHHQAMLKSLTLAQGGVV